MEIKLSFDFKAVKLFKSYILIYEIIGDIYLKHKYYRQAKRIYNSAIRKIIENETENKYERVFINLKQKVNSLINQYKIYEELIKKIKYVGNNTDLLNQNNQKINNLNIFIQNLDENISFFEKIISNKTFKNNNVFTIKFKEIEYENEDIRKYFYDFGLLTIFTLKPSDSCIIF